MEYLIYLQFLIGLVFLIKGADFLVEGSTALAKRIGVSDMIIGLTVVSFGTSAPELSANIFASLNGNASLAFGNIIGSNIANILLILGVPAVIVSIPISSKVIWKNVPLNLLAVFTLFVLVNDQLFDPNNSCKYADSHSFCNLLGRGDSIILLLLFAIFIYSIAKQAKTEKVEPTNNNHISLWKSLILTIIGLAGLLIGGDWIVDGAVYISKTLGMSEAVIGITIVGIGTSLPEIATSVIAAYRGRHGIVIGNALGSNVFNIFWVLGLSAFINPLTYETSMNTDIAMMGCATLILFFSMFIGKRYYLGLTKGVFFLILYATYIIFLLLNSAF